MWESLYRLSRPEDEACRGSAMVLVEVSGAGVGKTGEGRKSSPRAYSIRKTSAAVGFMYTEAYLGRLFSVAGGW